MAAQAITRHGGHLMATRKQAVFRGERLRCTYFRESDPEPMMPRQYGDDTLTTLTFREPEPESPER